MYYSIITARHIEGYKLELTFENGMKGAANLEGYIKKGGVFGRFSDPEYFKKFFVNKELGALCWPDGVDIAPETLFNMATGGPLPAWAKLKESDAGRSAAG